MRLAASALALLAALAPLLTLGACARTEARDDRELRELERLCFAPVGRLRLEGFPPPFDDSTLARPLLVDAHEFTWGQWRELARWDPERAPAATTALVVREGFERGADALPAVLTQREAASVAAGRGMRVPTPAEWIYVACGTSGLRYPWGSRDQASLANTLELGLFRPAAVGTFEGGRGPFGNYDLVGNVWEWVDGAVRGIEPAGVAYPTPELARGLCSAMGGSYRVRRQELYVPAKRDEPAALFALLLDRDAAVEDVGFRAVVDAEEFLRARAASWRHAPAAEARVRAVGRRFGAPAEALLRALADEPGASIALRWLHEGSLRP
jgi:hypothetical protein